MEQKQPLVALQWRDGGKAPFWSYRGSSVVAGNVAYFSSLTAGGEMYSYESSLGKRNKLLDCPQLLGSLALIKGLLTMVGGCNRSDYKTTNKLVSLIEGNNKWVELFPPMPTGRTHATANTYHNHLIVAGGTALGAMDTNLDTVEVLNTETLVWSTAASLPHPFADGSATIVSGRLYLLGGNDRNSQCRSVFSCSLPDLIQSCQATKVDELAATKGSTPWQREADIPVYRSTCATVQGQLVAVGGEVCEREEVTSAVFQYNPNSRSWSVVNRMATNRRLCYVVAMENDGDQLMVVGGTERKSLISTNSVEIVGAS